MKTALIPISFILISIACASTKVKSKPGLPDPTIPACIQEQLSRIENKQYENPPVQIDEYEYEGKRMFLFTADCCDQYNILFDENCKGLCAPSGGIIGKGDGKCSDFKEKAKLVRNIYKKQ